MSISALVSAPEGKARFLMAPGEDYVKTLMSWEGYFISNEETEVDGEKIRKGDVLEEDEYEKVEKKPLRPVIGSLFFKIPIYHSVYTYELEWGQNHYRGRRKQDSDEDEKEDEAKKDEKFDYVELRDQYFRSKIEKTTGAPRHRGLENKEEASGNRVDVEVQYLVNLRIRNPYRFCFRSPPNALDAALERLDNVVGKIISQSEFNLVERLQGSNEALWHGIKNPDEYDLSQKEEEIWREYKSDITNAEKVDIVFEGIKNRDVIMEGLRDWGIEVMEKGVELITVEPPPEVKEERKKLIKKDFEMEETKRRREMAQVEADIRKEKAKGEKEAFRNETAIVNELAEGFMENNCSVNKAYELAMEMYNTAMAAQRGTLKKLIYKGLSDDSGFNLAGLAAKWMAGRDSYRESKAGFIDDNENHDENSSDNGDEKEWDGKVFKDSEGNKFFL